MFYPCRHFLFVSEANVISIVENKVLRYNVLVFVLHLLHNLKYVTPLKVRRLEGLLTGLRLGLPTNMLFMVFCDEVILLRL